MKLVEIGKSCSGSCDLGQRPSYAYNGSYISKNISEPFTSSKVVALAMLHSLHGLHSGCVYKHNLLIVICTDVMENNMINTYANMFQYVPICRVTIVQEWCRDQLGHNDYVLVKQLSILFTVDM